MLGILEGLDEEALRRPVLPSGWTCLGPVRHLPLDMERCRFRGVVAGEQTVIDELATTPDATWRVGPDLPFGAVVAAYRREMALTNAIVAATPLDTAPAWWPPEHVGDLRLHDPRECGRHVMTETGCHAGRLDAARELIDVRGWPILTG